MSFAPQQVLCAVDFSELSTLALKYAATAARAYDARLLLLHAQRWELPPYFTRAETGRLTAELAAAKRAARRFLADYARKTLGPTAKTLNLELRVVEKHPVDAILDQRDADLIVLGTHGRGGAKRLWLGSVAENVIRHAAVPVFVARQTQHQFIDARRPGAGPVLRRILCPVNFTAAARAALEVAASIAARFNAQLTVLHVAEPQQQTRASDALEQLCGWIPKARAAQCALEPLVRRGRPADQILRFADAEHADLVVLGAQPRPAVQAIFFGTTAEPVLRRSPAPVLFVPRPG